MPTFVHVTRARRGMACLLIGSLVALAVAAPAAAVHPRLEHVSAGAINGNGAYDVTYRESSEDGSRIFLHTDEQLTADDTDSVRDVYERSGGTTKRISVGAINGNGAFAARLAEVSADGSRLFFETVESLVASDTDSMEDIYQRSGDVTTQVSVGTINGNGAFEAGLSDISDDGSVAFFRTDESLGAGDTDTAYDIYERAGGVTQRLSKGTINGNLAIDARFEATSADGSHLFFATDEALVAADTDAVEDIYERTAGVTTLVSAGVINGNGPHDAEFEGVSADGVRVLFITAEQLVAADTDSSVDLYRRQGGVTYLVSSGAINGNGAFDVTFEGASDDATHIFFETDEPLAATDTDAVQDVYERAGGVTSHLSIGAVGGNGPQSASFQGSSSDGTIVFMHVPEALEADDTDSAYDTYQRTGGVTSRVSVGAINGNSNVDTFFRGASDDGTRVVFQTTEQLAASDSDGSIDAYERSAGVTSVVTPGNGAFDVSVEGMTADGSIVVYETDEAVIAGDADTSRDLYAASIPAVPPVAGAHSRYERVSSGKINGNGAFDANSMGASADGATLFFETREALVAADTDGMLDVYRRTGGVTTRISTGSAGGNGAFDAEFLATSEDGSAVVFQTEESLVAGDTDAVRDIYQRTGSVTRRISAGAVNGNGAFHAHFHGMSSDGRRFFFSTDEQLVAADTDSAEDVYRRFNGGTSRISTGAVNGNGAFDATFQHVTSDGLHVFFVTDESLAVGDTDAARDVYERAAGVTTHLSSGVINGNGANRADFVGASVDGSRVFFTTEEPLAATDTDGEKDVYRRYSGATAHMSRGAINGNGAYSASFLGASSDGTRVFMDTSEPLVATDTDTVLDIYERAGGVTTHLTVGAINGNGPFHALYEGTNTDGSRMFFKTSEPLVASDTEVWQDVYERSAGSTTILTSGTINGNGSYAASFRFASLDGTTVFFESEESLDAADTDTENDVYARTGGVTTYLTPGNEPEYSTFGHASDDGSTMTFVTDAAVTADDEDSNGDVYAVYRAP